MNTIDLSRILCWSQITRRGLMASIKRSLQIYFFIFFILPVNLYAQQDSIESQLPLRIGNDSTVVNQRNFDQATVEELKANPELEYGNGPAAMSIWERFKRGLGEILYYLFEQGASADWVEILIYVVIIGILGYTILWLLRIDAVKMFFSKRAVSPIHSVVLEENIHEVDFEKRINEALKNKAYRDATRLLFLHALKILSDRDLIHWQPGKTNHDYINELESEKLKPGFNDLNYFFEYAWYGHFDVNESVFTKAQHTFENWQREF